MQHAAIRVRTHVAAGVEDVQYVEVTELQYVRELGLSHYSTSYTASLVQGQEHASRR